MAAVGKNWFRVVGSLAWCALASPWTFGQAPELISVRLFPSTATLQGQPAAQQFVVIGKYSDGLERDLTSASHFSVRDADLARVDEAGLLRGLSDGETELLVEVEQRSASAVIRVQEAQRAAPFSFVDSITPILTKNGCNGSNCHGGVKGRGGFKLSLYALNPAEDYRWIARGGVFDVLVMDTGKPEIPRVNLAEPAQSLLLKKPSMQIPHGGGPVIDTDSRDFATLLRWIENGASFQTETESHSKIVGVEVFPTEVVLAERGTQRLIVTARLSDGRLRDISREVRYDSQNPDVVRVASDGLITASRRGETNVLVRAAGHTIHSRVGVVSEAIADYPEIARRNLVDEHVFAKLERFHLLPSELSDEAEFLRRVCLDLIGTLPPPERVNEFLGDPDPDKRDELIEKLLDSPEYVDYWTFRFSDLLRVVQEPYYSQLYFEWIRGSVAENKPYDQMAFERLAAQGRDRPASHFWENNSQPSRIISEELRVYMGRRFDCAECHDHPFEPWSQDQFWGLAAFYGNLDFIGYYDVLFDNPAGGYGDKGQPGLAMHPRKKVAVTPAYLDGTPLAEEKRLDPRSAFAEWLTAHPYFSEAIVNRIWGYFFGRGIVDPVDDFKASNPPTHPRLLEALAADFRENGHDLKRLIRLIAQSRTYQLSSRPNANNRDDRINYSHFIPRPLDAELLLDAMSQVTGVPEVFHEKPESLTGQPPPGTRAIQLKSPVRYFSQFLDLYGRPFRHAVPERDADPSLTQALHIYAGKAYTEKISKTGGRLDQLLEQGKADLPIVQELYLAALTRFPEKREQSALMAALEQAGASGRRQALADLTWALLTSREFSYQH